MNDPLKDKWDEAERTGQPGSPAPYGARAQSLEGGIRMRTLLRGTALLLGVIALLSGCEEAMDPKPASRPAKPEQPAQLYTKIGADDLIERWSVLPNGAVAEMESRGKAAGYRLASATGGFSDLAKYFVFKDARKYGTCVVFTLLYQMVGQDDDGNLVEVEVPAYILDCVGESAADIEGLFHVAQMCTVYPDFIIYYVRAGNADPKINKVESDVGPDGEPIITEHVSVAISTHPADTKKSWDDFAWYKYAYPANQEPIPIHFAVGTNWPHDEGGARHEVEFDAIGESTTHMRFSIDDSHGRVKFEDNDGAAYKDHKARCDSIDDDWPEGGPGEPGELTSEQ